MEKEYKIEIRPEILELLGPSLYTNIYYVLAELIANAYDADAKNVYVIKEDDAIIVEDDGSGMDYRKVVDRYLRVAEPTRIDQSTSFTSLGRRKMGRKGIGKLAALSVSSRVKVITRSGNELNGFVLSRSVPDDGRLEPLDEKELVFRRVERNGTAIVMENPEYEINKTLASWKHNLQRLFPFVDHGFRIHLINRGKEEILDGFEKSIIAQLSTLITIGDEFKRLESDFKSDYPDIRDRVCVHLPADELSKTINVRLRNGEERECEVSIRGWIGTYKTVSNRKKNIADFPDNFVSLFANGKLGAFNVLPEIGRNRMGESYVVAQLHIDCFEDTDLPDMAMSNRQGYKSDDARYRAAMTLIRENLLDQVLRLRDVYTDRKSEEQKRQKIEDGAKNEKDLSNAVEHFIDELQTSIKGMPSGTKISEQKAGKIANDARSLLGFKQRVDSGKKRLLISHAGCDKEIADLLYKLLIFNGIAEDEILYTSSEDEAPRIPEGVPIYDYLRDFFVTSASKEMLNVLFVTSDESVQRWAPVCEVGAAWVTRASHKIFTVNGNIPNMPLDTAAEWLNFKVDEDKTIALTRRDKDVLKVKVKDICYQLGVEPRSDSEIMSFIEDRVNSSEDLDSDGE